MEINLMVLSVGNSRLAIGVFVGGTLEYSTRVNHSDKADWPGKLAEAWRLIADSEAPDIAPPSVNPAVLESLEHVVQQQTQRTVEWVGREIDLPIPVLTDEPASTGVDRILNVAAAFEQIGKACIVADAGTALTVDLCDDKGQFLGGAIAPGVRMQLEALHTGTAKLPAVDFAVPDQAIGRNTEAAIRLGVYSGARGMVKELAEQYAMELGQWPEVVATGGDAVGLFDGWELIHAVAPDLTLYGIALAYANHHIKHDEK